jgi:transposase InsO family protein
MKQCVAQFVQGCEVCQQAKVEHVKLPGLLQPLSVPQQSWSTVSMDFIEGLPKLGKWDTILVVVDKFSKYAHFLTLSHPYTALQVVQQYFDHIYKLHGMPSALISDRDKIFTSTLWKELFKLSDTQLLMSSSYHPQTNGQIERINQCLEGFLRCAVHSCPKDWSKWLPLAEFWYNTAYQFSLDTTPFEVLYGHHPRQLSILDPQATTVPDLAKWMSERQLLNRLIQQQLLRAQQRMKHQADKNRTEREFSVGDKVYLKLQPHVQSSVAFRSNHKLSYRFYGPFQITERVGAVAYKLQLPASALIHQVVHVS